MFERTRIIGAGAIAAAVLLAAPLLAAALPCSAFAESAAGEKTAPSPKMRELMTSLAQAWLEEQGVTKPPVQSAQQSDNSFEDYANSAASALHDQFVALARAVPDLPSEFAWAAARITAIDPDSERGQVFLDLGVFGDRYMTATRRLAAEAEAFLNLAVFGACGFGAQWLFRRLTARVRHRLDGLPMDTVNDRLRVITARFALGFGVIGAFVLGGLGPWLVLDWDPVRREMVLSVLIVFVVIWAAAAAGDLLLAPNDERFRIIPIDPVAARFWCRRLIALAGSLAFVWVIIQECNALNFSFEGVQLVGYTLGLGVVAIALEAVLRRPIAPRGAAEGAATETRRFGLGAAASIAVSIGVVLLWLFWVTAPGVLSVDPAFWLVFVLTMLPPAISVSRRAVGHLLRPPASSETAGYRASAK
jgi:hypothetical protein